MSSFRFATANLFTRFVDPGDLARVLDEVAPDLLVTVELAPKAAEVVADRFPHHHLEPDEGFEGWGISGRLALEVDPGPPPWRRGGSIHVDLGSTTLHVAALHLYDPVFGPPRKLAALRKLQVEALLEWGSGLPPDEPQVLAGDFNATPIWKAYRRLVSRWPDVVAASPTGARRTWGIPPGVRLLRIDHILGTGVEATSTRVVRVRGSDHAMVVADLRLV